MELKVVDYLVIIFGIGHREAENLVRSPEYHDDVSYCEDDEDCENVANYIGREEDLISAQDTDVDLDIEDEDWEEDDSLLDDELDIFTMQPEDS